MTLTAITALFGAGVARADQTTLDADTAIGAPATYQNLTFYPLVTRADAPPTADYLVLDEGLKSGDVQVIEKGEGVVNTLTLKNQSKRPLFVMSGEVVIGGKQDRIIGKDQIISAQETVDVPVFCVEHGRWTESTTGRRFSSAGSMADTKVRKQAAYKDNQGEVWSKVAEKNAKRGIANATGTYRQVATGGEVGKAVEPYEKALGPALDDPRAVGMVVALNGKVVGVEQFASPSLFAKLKSKLARSYYVDAIDQPVEKAPPSASADDIRGFVAKADAGKASVVMAHRSTKTTRKQAQGVVGSEVTEDKAPAKPVYKSVQTDE
jgi:hypothetical protein